MASETIPVDDATKPALRKLEQDQEQVIKQLREGFADGWEFVYWLHDLSAATLGEIGGENLKKIARDTVVKRSLIKEFDAGRELADGIPERQKQGIEEYILHPRFNDGFKKLRGKANEYLSGDHRPSIHPDAPVALLPGVDELVHRQRTSLERFRDGFDTYNELLDWRRNLIAATYGKISSKHLMMMGKKDRVFTAIVTEGAVGTPPSCDFDMYRRKTAYYILLPAFNSGIRSLVRTAGEDLDANREKGGDSLDV